MKINITIEINDPEQTLELDDGLSDDEIEEAVAEFAAMHAQENHTHDWHKDE